MTARTAFTLAGILAVVAALSAIRFAGREEPGAPETAAPAPAPVPATAPVPAPAPLLPSLLDFGRDT